MEHARRRDLLSVLGIVALAFGVRVVLASAFVGLGAPPDAQANPDQLEFEQLAWQLAQGHGFVLEDGTPTGRRAVGAVATMAPPYAVAGRSYTAGRLWLALLSAATCGLCVWIGWVVFGRGVGLLAGLGLALYPGHAYYAMHYVSEAPFAFWLALGTGLSLHGLKHAWRWRHALAGVAWGMAILTKPQFVLLIPGVLSFTGGAWLILSWRRLDQDVVPREDIPWAWMRAALITCLMAIALAAPWAFRNAAVMGTPGLSTIVGHTLWGSNNEVVLTDPDVRGLWVRTSALERTLDKPLPAGEAAANKAATGYALGFMRTHRGAWPGLVLSKLRRLVTPWPTTENSAVRWAEGLAWCVVGPLALIGLITGWKRHRAAVWVLLFPLGVTLAVTVVFYGSVRFRNALAPILLVFAAVGAVRIAAMIHTALRGHNKAAKTQARAITQPLT